MDARRTETCVAPVDASRDFYSFSQNEQRGVWGGGALPDFFVCSLFPVQQTTSGIGHRVKYFWGLATNTLNMRNNNNSNDNNTLYGS